MSALPFKADEIAMSQMCQDQTFRVFEAVNADQVVTVVGAPADVQTVVTDIEMPSSMDSLEPARMVQEPWPGIGVVVTSGRVRPGPDDLSQKVAFLSKPYLPDTVIKSSARWPSRIKN
jgi:CheY-like chemotaxis protein